MNKYTFKQPGGLELKSGNDKSITIHNGCVLQFTPEPNTKTLKEVDVFQIKMTHQTRSAPEITYFNGSKNLVTAIIEKSIKNKITEDASIYDIDPNTAKVEELAQKFMQHINQLGKDLKNKDLSANFEKIEAKVLSLSQWSDTMDESLDFNKLSEKQKKMVQSISTQPESLDLKEKNKGLTHSPFVYIRSIEKCALGFLDEAKNYVLDAEISMGCVLLNDMVSVLRISNELNKGNIIKAYNYTSLDTSVREQLPEKFWEKWVMESDKQSLKEEQAKYNADYGVVSSKKLKK